MGIFDKLFGKKEVKTVERSEVELILAKKLFHKSYVHVELGLPWESIKFLDKALKIDPQFADALNGKGMALGWVGNYEEVIRCFNEALNLNPKFAWCWAQKGIALNEFGKERRSY